MFADPGGYPHRTQPPYREHGFDHGDGDGVSGEHRSDRPASCRPAGNDAAVQRIRNGRVGKSHETAAWEVSPSGPTDRWPTRSGFDKFYGFMGGETNQWAATIYDGMTRAEVPRIPTTTS